MKNKTSILIIILAIITATAVGISIWAIFFRNNIKNETDSDYAPQQVESNAEKIEGDDSSKLDQEDGGGAVSLTYSRDVTLSIDKKEASLIFQNPSKSNQNMKLEIVIDDKTIVSSGKLEPGYKVDKLSNVDIKGLSEGNYEGKFVVSYYDSDSNEKAILNTEIPISIKVIK